MFFFSHCISKFESVVRNTYGFDEFSKIQYEKSEKHGKWSKRQNSLDMSALANTSVPEVDF